MTAAELKTELKHGRFARLFIFAGEEDYLKRHYIGELRRAIIEDDTLAVFNHTVLEGESIDFSALRDALEAPPMMADYKLIEWHLCDIDRMKEAELAELATLAERCREIGWACIVLRADKAHFDLGTLPKRPSKRYKEISAFADVVDFPRSTEPQLIAWIERHFAHDGIAVSPDVCRAIIARAGHSMDTLANEIEKLICTQKAKGRNVLSACDLEGVLSATSEEDAFALTNALLARDAEKAYAQLLDLRRRRVDPLIVLGSVSRLYGELVSICRLRDEGLSPAEIGKMLKIHEYPLSLRLRALQGKEADEPARALAACRALDASKKSNGGMDVYVGLDRLIAEFVCQ